MSPHSSNLVRSALAVAVLVLLTACTSLTRNPVPIDDMDRAVIPGMPGVRDWGDEPSPEFQRDLIQSVRDAWQADGATRNGQPMTALVLSGGGSNGAFGAGFLCGWSETGNRPAYKLVTGISTGALIAPYAFLGPEYDDELREVFTNVTNKDVYKIRNPLTALKKDSLARTEPLALRLEAVITADILEAIAAEHRRGRRLYVGTTNLDAQRLVVWNMGAIAASGRPGSLELFRRVLLASASIPVAFPPVYIEVEVDGRRFDEMHVDGGVIAEFFLWGAMVDIADAAREVQVDPEERPPASIYIIRNSQIEAAPEQVKPKLVPIASRSMITVLKAVAMGDLIRVWALAVRDGVDFNYVGIPPEHPEATASSFDPAEMQRLFDLGRSMALEPDPWRKDPPSFVR
jgi:predicted acylesterase/phospholipase RssA